MGILAGGAKLLADRTGGDTATAFDTLSGAIASGRTNSLKALGLFVDSDKAASDFAKSIGKTPEQLSAHEKAAGLAAGVTAELKKQLEQAGPSVKDFGDFIDIGKAAVSNFTDNLGLAIATSPVVQAAMGGIADSISSAFGGTQQETVNTLRGYVDTFAFGVITAAQVAVEGARVIVYAWDGVKAAFNVIVGFTVDSLGTLLSTFGKLIDGASQIPGIGDKFKPVADAVKGIGGDLEHLATGFYAQASAAVDSAADSKLAFDTISDGLSKAKDEMGKVQGAAVELGDKGPGAVKQLIEPVQMTAAELKAMEDATRKGRDALFELGDEGAAKFKTLQDELTLANLSGTEARLFEIQQAQEKELAGLQGLALAYPELYQQNVDAVTEKYRLMTEAASGHYSTEKAMAEAAGYKTRDELQQTADNAKRLYDEMKESGKYTDGQLAKAHKDYTDKVKALDGERTLTATQQFDLIANAAKGLISAVFGKGKAGAIATAIIDTAQAVVKALASAPPPLNYALAAAVGAAGLIQINKIRSTEVGFAAGTPGTSFVDFGRETVTALHGNEAVVNKAQGATLGEVLSSMVREALEADRGAVVEELRRGRADAAADRKLLPIHLAAAVAMARA